MKRDKATLERIERKKEHISRLFTTLRMARETDEKQLPVAVGYYMCMVYEGYCDTITERMLFAKLVEKYETYFCKDQKQGEGAKLIEELEAQTMKVREVFEV